MSFFLSSSLCLLATGLFYVNEPVVSMKEWPTSESKVVSQALFAEEVQVEKRSGEWVFIYTSDTYSGWIRSASFVQREEPYATNVQTSRLAAHVYRAPDIEYEPMVTLPYGSKIQALDLSCERWVKIRLPDSQEGYIQKGDIEKETVVHDKRELVAFSKKFIGLPYTWGGRSSFGYDCSGFIQMLYKQIGCELPRDARQQIVDGRLKKIEVGDLEPGDLIFFGKSESQVTHVGMYIGDDQFIQSTVQENKPWIRISQLTDAEWNGRSERFPYRAARRLIKELAPCQNKKSPANA